MRTAYTLYPVRERAAVEWGQRARDRVSVAWPPIVRAHQHVLLKAEIVRDGERAAPVTPPLAHDGHRASPPLPLPPVQEHGECFAVAVGVPEAVVQIWLVPCHDQQAAHGRARGWRAEPSRGNGHGYSLQGIPAPRSRSHIGPSAESGVS